MILQLLFFLSLNFSRSLLIPLCVWFEKIAASMVTEEKRSNFSTCEEEAAHTVSSSRCCRDHWSISWCCLSSTLASVWSWEKDSAGF